VDGLLGLKGKPFGRFMTVMGSSLGALLPDVWDWEWLRESAAPAEREVVQEQVCRAAAELPEADALALFDWMRARRARSSSMSGGCLAAVASGQGAGRAIARGASRAVSGIQDGVRAAVPGVR
jgi:hypothetical protein